MQVALGTSFDVHELDAASNNGVEAMRDLVARAALGTPGRWKVYIVDEVHMLSTAASNALLKTLEEPPGHVVFVLATTDPQRVIPTIRSRTQHFEFRLLSGTALADLVRHVQDDAGLDLPAEAVDLAVRRGNGSARDALSVLDQISAAGTVDDGVAVLDELVEALTERDAGRALVAVAEACAAGWDVQRLANDLVEHLRWGFLATMAPRLVPLTDEARQRVDEQGRRLGPAALVRSIEVVGPGPGGHARRPRSARHPRGRSGAPGPSGRRPFARGAPGTHRRTRASPFERGAADTGRRRRPGPAARAGTAGSAGAARVRTLPRLPRGGDPGGKAALGRHPSTGSGARSGIGTHTGAGSSSSWRAQRRLPPRRRLRSPQPANPIETSWSRPGATPCSPA